MRFPIALHTDDGVAYGVTVPDLPGCFSAGDTLDDAIENAKEAIDGHVELLVEDGGDVPVPGAVAAHAANPDFAGAVWAVVDVPIEQYLGPAQRVNITVPAAMLDRIDKFAEARGESRSAFLVRAAQAAMAGAAPRAGAGASGKRQPQRQ
jgi:predicted RNase H-like HicB family nuclease